MCEWHRWFALADPIEPVSCRVTAAVNADPTPVGSAADAVVAVVPIVGRWPKMLTVSPLEMARASPARAWRLPSSLSGWLTLNLDVPHHSRIGQSPNMLFGITRSLTSVGRSAFAPDVELGDETGVAAGLDGEFFIAVRDPEVGVLDDDVDEFRCGAPV